MRIDGIRGGGYTQQSNDEGVHGEHLFARKLYYNDVIDNRMTTTTTTRIQWCWQWGLLLMESRGGSYTQQSNDEGVCV